MVRLVKGAYWDTEIKRAQERGLDDYPVFTRKAMTDLNYIACARKLLALRPRIFPQFATHNALTVATVLELAGGESGFEFQRLHGMGEALYAQLGEDHPRHRLPHLCAGRQPSRSARLSGAAAAGERRQLVVRGASPPTIRVPVATLLRRPADIIGTRRQRAASEYPAAARSLSAAAAEFARHRIRRARGVGRAGCRGRAETAPSRSAADRRQDRTGPHGRSSVRSIRQPSSEASSRRRRTMRSRAAARVRISTWSRTPAADARGNPGARRRPAGAARGAFHRAAATRGRQDAGRCALGGARGRRFLPLLRRAGPRAVRRRRSDAGPDRREQRAAAARPRRVRRDLAVEFSAGDLSRARSRRR